MVKYLQKVFVEGCMIHSAKVSRKRDKYDKQYLKNAPIYDSYFVFDMALGGSFVCGRNISKRSYSISSVFDIMSDEECKFAFEYAKSYTSVPAAVSTRFGIALLLPHLAPSSSLFAVVAPRVRGDVLCKVMRIDKKEPVYSPEALTKIKRRVSLKDGELDECRELISRIESVFVDVSEEPMLSGNIDDTVIDRAFEISCYAGCPIGILCGESLKAIGDFDYSLFVGMLFVLLTCARRVSPKKEASLVIEQTSYGSVFTVSFELSGVSQDRLYEVDSCRRIASRKNILFEVMADNKVAHVRFSPISHEWSYLELKSPENNKEIAKEDEKTNE